LDKRKKRPWITGHIRELVRGIKKIKDCQKKKWSGDQSLSEIKKEKKRK
jgi:hypothetical protein